MGSFIVVKLNLYPEGWTSSIPIFSFFGSPCSNHCSYSQGCSLDRERLSLQTVSGRFLNVSVSSWYCHLNVSVSPPSQASNISVLSWSRHHTSHLQPWSQLRNFTWWPTLTKWSIFGVDLHTHPRMRGTQNSFYVCLFAGVDISRSCRRILMKFTA